MINKEVFEKHEKIKALVQNINFDGAKRTDIYTISLYYNNLQYNIVNCEMVEKNGHIFFYKIVPAKDYVLFHCKDMNIEKKLFKDFNKAIKKINHIFGLNYTTRNLRQEMRSIIEVREDKFVVFKNMLNAAKKMIGINGE